MRGRNKDFLLVVLGLGLGLLITTAIFWARGNPGGNPAAVASGGVGAAAANLVGVSVRTYAPPLLEASYAVAAAINLADYDALSQWASPQGVLFAPYSTVDKSLNLVFSPAEVKKFGTDSAEKIWGVYDVTGEPILKTPVEYIDEFLRGDDFTKAPSVFVNTVAKKGNSLENVTEAFPGASFVDLHYPGADGNGGPGWRSLRLVFEPDDTGLKLIAVIHCAKTA